MNGKILIKCPHCAYKWETQSEMQYVSCPRCLKKVNIEENRIVKKPVSFPKNGKL